MHFSDPIRMGIHQRTMDELRILACESIESQNFLRLARTRLGTALRSGRARRSIRETADDGLVHNYFSDHKIAVYTAIHGNYDTLKEPITVPDNCDFFVVTDQPMPENSVWQKRTIDFDQYGSNWTNVRKSRFAKMHPHLLFPDYEYSIYIDGTFQVRTDVTEFIQTMPPSGIKIHRHPTRSCVYDEIEACIRLGKDDAALLSQQRDRLRAAGVPRHYGLLETGVVIRHHAQPACQAVMALWWEELSAYSTRDQVALIYALWKLGIPVSEIGVLGPNMRENYAFSKSRHNR
jgi:hypothetical protein